MAGLDAAASIAILSPGSLGSNPRVVKEAQALHEAGYRVTVISTRTLSAVDSRDDSVLAKAGWKSVRLDFRRKVVRAPRRIVQSVFARAFSLTGATEFALRGISFYTGALFSAALPCDADLYIGHYPSGLVAAGKAAARRRVPLAFDAEDFHLGDQPPGPEFDLDRRLVRAVEGSFLPRCSYVTAASPGIAEAYAAAYGIEWPAALLNVFPLDQAPASSTPRGSATPGPSVYWFSQTIGPDRGLECAVHAIGLAQSRPHLYLRGTAAAGFAARLQAIAVEAQAADRVHILAPEAPAEMERLASRYDVGLVSEVCGTISRQIALTNKVFSYLLAGLPIVASDIPAHRTFQLHAGNALSLYAADDATALAATLDAILLQPDKLAGARAHAFELGQTRFNWDLEKKKLLNLVSSALEYRANKRSL
ncbi:MAG: glycosyltransferase [Pseudolabrys sp.]